MEGYLNCQTAYSFRHVSETTMTVVAVVSACRRPGGLGMSRGRVNPDPAQAQPEPLATGLLPP